MSKRMVTLGFLGFALIGAGCASSNLKKENAQAEIRTPAAEEPNERLPVRFADGYVYNISCGYVGAVEEQRDRTEMAVTFYELVPVKVSSNHGILPPQEIGRSQRIITHIAYADLAKKAMESGTTLVFCLKTPVGPAPAAKTSSFNASKPPFASAAVVRWDLYQRSRSAAAFGH